MTTTKSEKSKQVEDVLEEYEGLIRYAADRYSANGSNSRYTEEDLYQEACIAILDTLEDFDPGTEDFRKMFKTIMFRRLMDIRNYQNHSKRDERKDVSIGNSQFFESVPSSDNSTGQDTMKYLLTDISSDPFVGPQDQYEMEEFVGQVSDELQNGDYDYYKEAMIFLDEIRFPSERVMQAARDRGLKGLKKKFRFAKSVYADAYGWSSWTARQALNDLRDACKAVLPD